MICFTIFRLSLVAWSFACCAVLSASAHEFWIEPERYQVASGDTLIAQFKNGEGFKGINLGFFDRRSVRFDYTQNGDTVELAPRTGNIPVLEMPAPGDGLMVIAHETTASSITYKEWDKFQAFADHKDFPDMRARQLARDLPLTEFSETYTRHVKALVGVGSAGGSDGALGLETEFVALANPYTADMSDGFPVLLLYQGAPRTEAQVEVFARAPDGSITISTQRTDDLGEAVIAVQSGYEYLLDAVVLREASGDSDDVWETLWAALSFRVP